MTRRATFKDQGSIAFTLIEVLVASAIFGMAVLYLMSTFVNAVTARQRSVSDDALNADIQAVRMQLLLEPNLEDAEDGGEYPTLNHGEASWQAVIQPTNIVDLFDVELSIQFSEPPEGRTAGYRERLYLLRPTWSEGDERTDLLEDKREALEDYRDFDRF
jgi:prepilin-type N-terminal cleavage/methylation domain-containing protein